MSRPYTPGHVIDDLVIEALADGPMTVRALRDAVPVGGRCSISRSLLRLNAQKYARCIGSKRANTANGAGRPSQLWELM